MKWKLRSAIAAAWLLAASSAEPCSCLFPPDHGFLIEHATELPLNASGIVWVGASTPSAEDFDIVRVIDGAEERARFDLRPLPGHRRGRRRAYLVELAERTIPGEVYRFRTSLFQQRRGDASIQERQLRVSEESLILDHDSVEYRLSEPATRPVSIPMGMSCTASVDALAVRAEVDLPPSLEKFREHLMFETLLNGASTWTPKASFCSVAVPGRSWIGAGRELFYRWCSAEHGLPEGMHVSVQALFFPAGDQQILTEPASFELSCEAKAP